jgi:hypothetical protein
MILFISSSRKHGSVGSMLSSLYLVVLCCSLNLGLITHVCLRAKSHIITLGMRWMCDHHQYHSVYHNCLPDYCRFSTPPLFNYFLLTSLLISLSKPLRSPHVFSSSARAGNFVVTLILTRLDRLNKTKSIVYAKLLLFCLVLFSHRLHLHPLSSLHLVSTPFSSSSTSIVLI